MQPSDLVRARVRELREEGGLSQATVAAAMRTHGHQWRQSTVSEVETGVRRVTVDEFVALAAVLEVKTTVLLPAPKVRPDVVLALASDPDSVHDYTPDEFEAAGEYLDALVRHHERRQMQIRSRQREMLSGLPQSTKTEEN